MDTIQQLLQTSAKLYKHLMVKTPKNEDRTLYIHEINLMLEERGAQIDQLCEEGFQMDENNKVHATLAQLDKGIQERLNIVMKAVQQDLKDLQNTKKNEKQYMNPYSNVQVMDGMYYDKKK